MIHNNFHSNLLTMQNKLMSLALILTHDRDNAMDLLQDTILKALDNREKYSEDTNFKGWLYTIMRNIFINNYRRAAYESTVVDTTESLFHLNLCQESGLDKPADTVETKEINQSIHNLPDELRIPFEMHITGYKYTEISEKLAQPMGTVKTHIHQARVRLQEELRDYA